MNIQELKRFLTELVLEDGDTLFKTASGKPLLKVVAATPSGTATERDALVIFNTGATGEDDLIYTGVTDGSFPAADL